MIKFAITIGLGAVAFYILYKQNKSIMGKQEQFDAMITRLNAATNDIAADLTLLKEQIAAGTVSDESLARLDQHIASLEALGASTENPVPEEPGGETPTE